MGMSILSDMTLEEKKSAIDSANLYISNKLKLQYIGESRDEVKASIAFRLNCIEQFLVAVKQYAADINTIYFSTVRELSLKKDSVITPEEKEAVYSRVCDKVKDLNITKEMYYDYSRQFKQGIEISNEELWYRISNEFITTIKCKLNSDVSTQFCTKLVQ